MSKRIRVAIIGTGNIGADLCERLLLDDAFSVVAFVGRRADSPGLKRMAGRVEHIIDSGIEGLIPLLDKIDGAFDATSAFDHAAHWDVLQKAGKWAIDLTPSRIGKPIVPELTQYLSSMEISADYASNYSMVTCGGQSSAPLVYAIAAHAVKPTEVEISSSIASLSAGPATRRNLDQYISSTENLATLVSAGIPAKAILVLNPADPPIMMRTTATVKAESFDLPSIQNLCKEKGLENSVFFYEGVSDNATVIDQATIGILTSVSVSGNVNSGNLRTTGSVSATGNITTAANVAGTFFIGNGSQLTGLSLGVSVTKFNNGTTEGNIGTPNGNINFNVAGTANVVIIDTNTLYVNTANVASISKSGSNAVGNIGSSTNYFNQVFATATTALYADVAERFASDELLEPGTVVELGGVKEITRSQQDLSENVFGVISTRPAYTMNGGAGEDDTHPKVAMTGRVPVKVVGYVRKGDRLVSAGSGVARAAQPGEATAFNVIGRSLIDKHTPEPGTIEAIVTIK
jgi:acetaldehyde dehydrogenase